MLHCGGTLTTSTMGQATGWGGDQARVQGQCAAGTSPDRPCPTAQHSAAGNRPTVPPDAGPRGLSWRARNQTGRPARDTDQRPLVPRDQGLRPRKTTYISAKQAVPTPAPRTSDQMAGSDPCPAGGLGSDINRRLPGLTPARALPAGCPKLGRAVGDKHTAPSANNQFTRRYERGDPGSIAPSWEQTARWPPRRGLTQRSGGDRLDQAEQGPARPHRVGHSSGGEQSAATDDERTPAQQRRRQDDSKHCPSLQLAQLPERLPNAAADS